MIDFLPVPRRDDFPNPNNAYRKINASRAPREISPGPLVETGAPALEK